MSGMSFWTRFRLWIAKITFPEYIAAESELRKLHDEVIQLETTNAKLLEALKLLLSHPSDDAIDAVETDDGYFLSPLNIAERNARKLIRNAEE